MSIPKMTLERKTDLVITWNSTQVLRFFLCIIVPLVVLGTCANFVIYHVASHPDDDLATVMRRFDLGHEPSLPNWYSSVALLVTSLLLAVIAWAKYRLGAEYVYHWTSLAILFCALAIDEAVLIHEMVDGLMGRLFDLHGALFFGWIIPGTAFVLCLAVLYGKFVWALPFRTRWLFMLAAVIFVGGAIGMEMVAGIIIESDGVESIWHTWSQAIEECMEMLGVAVIIFALVDYLACQRIGIRWQPASPSSEFVEGIVRANQAYRSTDQDVKTTSL